VNVPMTSSSFGKSAGECPNKVEPLPVRAPEGGLLFKSKSIQIKI
jgi:hypothetical protein